MKDFRSDFSEGGKRVSWQAWDESTTEKLHIQKTNEGFSIMSTTGGKGSFSMTYEITCDHDWRVKTCRIAIDGTGKVLELVSDSSGKWSGTNGAIPNEAGAIDIDISITPFTNTLPIRRLHLAEGESAEISVVYITVPDLRLSLERQRYTCLAPYKRYRFESLDGDFTRDIEVDEYGLVTLYPDLFRRIS